MATTSKKRGFRPVTVAGKRFNWRHSGVIDIRPDSERNNSLTVDFGWYDGWLYMNDRENEPPAFEPAIVTPDFVRRAIEFALQNQWDADRKNGRMELTFSAGVFRMTDGIN